jgi:hypothetical protein
MADARVEGYELAYNCDAAHPAGILNAVAMAIGPLHRKGFVHGDVRDANVMYRHLDGKYEILVLDFDEAGPIDVLRSPHPLNPQLSWGDADPSMPITGEQDHVRWQGGHFFYGAASDALSLGCPCTKAVHSEGVAARCLVPITTQWLEEIPWVPHW